MQELIDRIQELIATRVQPELDRLEAEKKALQDAIRALRGNK